MNGRLLFKYNWPTNLPLQAITCLLDQNKTIAIRATKSIEIQTGQHRNYSIAFCVVLDKIQRTAKPI